LKKMRALKSGAATVVTAGLNNRDRIWFRNPSGKRLLAGTIWFEVASISNAHHLSALTYFLMPSARFFTPRLRGKSCDELNAWLLDRCIAHAKAHRHLEVRDKTIWEMFEAEWPSLVPNVGLFDGIHAVPAALSPLIAFAPPTTGGRTNGLHHPPTD
jgi:hypothetical protein